MQIALGGGEIVNKVANSITHKGFNLGRLPRYIATYKRELIAKFISIVKSDGFAIGLYIRLVFKKFI